MSNGGVEESDRRCPRCPTLTDREECPTCGAETVEYRVRRVKNA